MWTRCLVCAADLGRNQEVEHFQVGNRLAYDPERGRLWVICPKCARWSLTPLEVRWEALEELERLWETAAAKVQGETLTLARMRSGLRVVWTWWPPPGAPGRIFATPPPRSPAG